MPIRKRIEAAGINRRSHGGDTTGSSSVVEWKVRRKTRSDTRRMKHRVFWLRRTSHRLAVSKDNGVGGSAAIDINAAIANTTGRLIDIQNRSGATAVTLSGNLNNNGGTGILCNNNSS